MTELSKLRAELARKDAALKKYADFANYSYGYYGEVTWSGAMDGKEDAPWEIARDALTETPHDNDLA